MKIIHFKSNFLPKIKKFKVEFNIKGERRFVELMTIARFLRWSKEIQNVNKKLVIGGGNI